MFNHYPLKSKMPPPAKILYRLTLAWLGLGALLLLSLAWPLTPAYARPPADHQPAASPATLTASAFYTAANLDLVLALDSTGSMEFDTICYGCWERCDGANVYSACAAAGDTIYSPYPRNGRAFPYNYDSPAMQNLRTGQPQPISGTDYIVLEAEFYSNNTSVWDPAYRSPDSGYWAMQRWPGANASSIDGRSGFVRHHPYYETSDTGLPFGHHYTLNDALNNTAPRLEYDFIPTWPSAATTFIYFRTQYFNSSYNTDPDNEFFWGISQGITMVVTAQQRAGGCSSGSFSTSNCWSWIGVNAGALTQDSLHTLKIWAGSPGYSIDKIIITTQSNINSPIDLTTRTATPGSAQRLAADPCNVIFGRDVTPADCTYTTLYTPTNNLYDPLFGDLQPMRGAKEAGKIFISRLNPAFDQIGFVDFDTTGTQSSQLECAFAAAARKSYTTTQSITYPPEMPGNQDYDELNCSDTPVDGIPPISYTLVNKGVEAAAAGNNTDIADGLRKALWELGITTDDDGTQTNDCLWSKSGSTWIVGSTSAMTDAHCGRGQAATPVIVLMTDGAPTDGSPGDVATDTAAPECTIDPNPKPYDTYPIGDDKYDCIMYYADYAAAHGVPICAIGLGPGVDPDLLNAVADRSHGAYYPVPSVTQLTQAFDTLLSTCVSGLGADLAITKAGPRAATPGALITYTLAVTNFGPLTPVTATLVDTWTPPEAVTAVNTPGCEVNLPGGVLTCTLTNLPVALEPAQVNIEFTTSPAFSGTLINRASITSTDSLNDRWPDNNVTEPVTTTIRGEANLFITKAGPAVAAPGEPITYTLTITNNGTRTATNLVITDALPAGASYITGGVKVGSVVSWPIPSLAPGSITQTTLVVTAAHPLVNADYAVAADEGVSAYGSTSVQTSLTGQTDLSISKSGPFVATAGAAVTYYLGVTNLDSVAPVTATLVDTWTPPEAVTAVNTPCAINLASGVFTCTLTNLPATSTPILVIAEFTTNPAFVGTLTNRATITAADNLYDWQPANNSAAPITLTLQAPVDLAIAKSGPVTAMAGAPITYTLTITNSGVWTATHLVITDALPVGASYLTGGVKVGNVISWTIDQLAPYDGVTYTTLIVTAARTITNSDYVVRAEGAYSAAGRVEVSTQVSANTGSIPTVYIPIIFKE